MAIKFTDKEPEAAELKKVRPASEAAKAAQPPADKPVEPNETTALPHAKSEPKKRGRKHAFG